MIVERCCITILFEMDQMRLLGWVYSEALRDRPSDEQDRGPD
jgi:hypothetical protein